MGVLGFILVYVLPFLFQMAVQVLVLSLGVYYGLKRYDRYIDRKGGPPPRKKSIL